MRVHRMLQFCELMVPRCRCQFSRLGWDGMGVRDNAAVHRAFGLANITLACKYIELYGWSIGQLLLFH